MRRFDRKVNFAEMRDFLSDNEFRLKYGLNPAAFDHVLDLIKADITDVPGGHGGIRNSAIVPPEVKLAVTLRWLRGAAYHDLYYEWGMSRSTFYRTWLRVCRAIMKQPSLALKLPQAIAAWKQGDSSMLSTLAAGFGRFTDGIFNFCVGAIDGVQIKINRPRATEDPAPNSYYTRRGIHALNVQAVADDRGSIIWASIRAPGAMHDSQAFSLSTLFLQFAAGMGRWFIVGDDAYVGKEHIATPFHGTTKGGTMEDNYQYYQALTRQPIERAFGMIERRWGILWRRIEVPLRHVPVIVYTLFSLHNICMEFNVPELPMTGAGQARFKALERSSDVLPESGRRRDREQSALRQALAEALAKHGMCRPPVAGLRRGEA